MINNNENKKVSRNRKRTIIRKNKMNDDVKLLLQKIKSEKKNKYKGNDKIKQLEILLVGIKYASNPSKLGSASRELNKINVSDRNLLEIENETLRVYNGQFEMIGNL